MFIDRARAVLDRNNNRMLLIEGLIACVLFTVSIMLLLGSLYDTFLLWRFLGEALALVVFDAAQWIFCFFLVFPLYLGVLRVAGEMSRSEEPEFSSFFAFYRSLPMLWRAWRIQLRILFRAFPILLTFAAYYVPNFFDSIEMYRLIHNIVVIASPFLIAAGLFTTSRFFPFAVLAVGNDSLALREAAKRARRAVKKKTGIVFVVRLNMLARLLLSILSFCVVTLIHTLPLTLIVYSRLADDLAET